VYTANYNGGTVSQYSINQATGALTSITTPISAGPQPYGIAVDPTGRFVYTANYNGATVGQYLINQITGALTSITSAISAGSNPNSLLVDPTGRFVYVVNESSGSISLYAINNFSTASLSITGTSPSTTTSTGALQVLGGVGIGGNLNIGGTLNGIIPGSINPSQNIRTERFIQTAYQPAAPRSRVYQGTGAPSFVSTMTGTVAGSFGGITIDPTGRFVYRVNDNNTTVSQFAINTSTGVLTTVSNAIAAYTAVQTVVVEASGRYAYVLNAGGGRAISQYSINQTTGVLTSIGLEFVGLTGMLYNMCIDPMGRYLFVTSFDSSFIAQLSINSSTGLLTSMGIFSSQSSQAQGQDGATIVDPTGRFLYIGGTGITVISIDQTSGALTRSGAVIPPNGPIVVYSAIEPSGRFLYASAVSGGGGSNTLYHYSINQTTGLLTLISSYSVTNSNQIIISPDGLFLYLSALTAGLNQYSINQTTGALTLIGVTTTGGTSWYSMKIDPTGRFMYAVIGGSINLYTLNNFSAGSGTISGSLNIASTVSSTSTTTGALQIAGGVGIGGNLTITNYTETRFTSTVTGNAITLSLDNGTFQTITTMVGANAITLPTVASGKSLTVQILYASTPTTLTFATPSGTLKWPGGTAPTPTLTNTKYDFYTFVSDGTNWYGVQSGANF
jgi:VCBS repeat-containing protein